MMTRKILKNRIFFGRKRHIKNGDLLDGGGACLVPENTALKFDPVSGFGAAVVAQRVAASAPEFQGHNKRLFTINFVSRSVVRHHAAQ
jgi:hypothetical protein